VLFYNVRIALLSLRRNRGLSAVIIGGIALGVAVSTMFSTIRHAFSRDPIPAKSGVLHYVRLDSWDPAKPYPAKQLGAPPIQITYRDMVEVMKSEIPTRQTGMFTANLYVFTDAKASKPRLANVRLCFSDFFPMFEVPFRYGTGWGKQADQAPEPVIVLSEGMNQTLFGGADSVGRSVRIENREFRVVGVLDHWAPQVKFYDILGNVVAPPEDVFMPFNFMRPMQILSSGNSDSWGPSPSDPGIEGVLSSERCWIQLWVELADGKSREAYEDFLNAYVQEQKKIGRFPRPINNRVTPLTAWLDEQEIVPKEATAMMVVSLLFLLVCALNLMGLLLGKFLSRAAEIGVRRALGARRIDVFVQHVVECELVGLVGGAVGLGLALGGLVLLNRWAALAIARPDFLRLDLAMGCLAFVLALVAGLVAGVYPAWRVCRIPPALHLKVQ
jgi:putative ABC transport system permease protein